MQKKIVLSHYDKNSGLSLVDIYNKKHGYFRGWSQLREEDKDIESSYAGCMYAEIKATIQLTKAEIKEINLKIKTLEDFEKVLKNMKEYNEHSFEIKRLRKEIFLYKKQKKELQNSIKQMTEVMLSEMEDRPKKIAKIMAKSKKHLDNND